MGCDAFRTLKIAAKWSISSHRVAGPEDTFAGVHHRSVWPGLLSCTFLIGLLQNARGNKHRVRNWGSRYVGISKEQIRSLFSQNLTAIQYVCYGILSLVLPLASSNTWLQDTFSEAYFLNGKNSGNNKHSAFKA